MAWTTPRTWIVGEIVTAALLNTHVRDNLLYIKDAPTFDTSLQVGSSTSYFQVTRPSATQSILSHTSNSSGQVTMDIDPRPNDGTSIAAARFFRSTNTTGTVALQILKGDNTATINSQLAGNTNSYFNAISGNVGIGLTSPQGKLHVRDNIGAWMTWDYDGLDGTTQVIMPDGTGDVLYGLSFMAVTRSSGGTVVPSGNIAGTPLTPGASTSIFNTGSDIVTLRVTASGQIEVQKTSGSLTYKVALWLMWI